MTINNPFLPLLTGVRLPFTLNTLTGGSAPTDDASAANGEVGRTIAWNWQITEPYVDQSLIPSWLAGLYDTTDPVTHSFNFWPIITQTLGATGTSLVQSIAAKASPIIVYNQTPGTLATHVWFRLDLTRNDPNRWFTCAEVEFYESIETATSARLTVRAKTTGAAGNSIATTETLTNGSWASATLTGGADNVNNFVDGETVTVGSNVYTFVTGALDATGKVKIGTVGSGSIANLIQAINGGSGAGTLYATGTTAHANVSASAGAQTGQIVITAQSHVAATAANAIAVSTDAVFGFFSTTGGTLTGGQDDTYTATPGFSFTSIVSALNQGAQGLEVDLSNETAELVLPDLRSGVWDKAIAVIKVINWAAPSGGAITLFGGYIGKITYDNEGWVSIEINNRMTRNLPWPAESWSPTCRAELGDHRCKFPIDSLRKDGTISTIVSQIEIKSQDIGAPPSFWQNGVIEILDGPNAGLAVELWFSDSDATGTGGGSGEGFVRAEAAIVFQKTTQNGSQWRRNPSTGATIGVNGTTFTFVTGANSGTNVHIVGSPGGLVPETQKRDGTCKNLDDAINAQSSTVRTDQGEDENIHLYARTPGASGNSYTLSAGSNANVHLTPWHNGAGVSSTGAGTVATTGASDTLKLASAFPFALTVGTKFRIWPGCQKRFIKDCRDRYHNTVNFRGEPFAPTSDNLKVQ